MMHGHAPAKSWLAGIVAVAALLSSFPGAGAAQVDSELIHPDPSVVYGRLPNGLRYAIKPHASHQKEVLQLYIAAGSLDEQDGEKGLAHYLEHMAFNGSRHFPAGSLIKTFEEAGIAFGRDQNASTDYFGTTYVLNIPNENQQKLNLGLSWLRDIADGLNITPEETSRERGVILSEYRQRLTLANTLQDARLRFLTPDLKMVDRRPIGDSKIIENADSRAINSFYSRWYRPENAILVAVGDEPAATVQMKIEAAFSNWSNNTPAPPPPDVGTVKLERGETFKALSDAHLTGGVLACRFSPKPPHRPESVSVTRERLADDIWSLVFAKRMQRLSHQDNADLLAATGAYSIDARAIGQTCFSANSRLNHWPAALDQLATEIRRMEIYGLTNKEFEAAKTQILSTMDANVRADATTPPEPVAKSILSNIIEGDTFDTNQEQRRVYQFALASLPKAEVSAAFQRHWSNAAPVLVLVSSPSPASDAEVAATWSRAMIAPAPGPPKDSQDSVWAYGDATRPGKVSKREVFQDPAFTRVTFQNGVVLNFKHTDFSRDNVAIHILFGAGQQELPPESAFDAAIASRLLYAGALKKNDLDDIASLCQNRLCNAGLEVGRDSFELKGSTRPSDLDVELQLLAAFITEPGFRASSTASLPTLASTFYRQMSLNPALLASHRLQDALPRPHVEELPSEAHIDNLTAEDFANLLASPLTHDPLEVTIVGDIDEATAVSAMSRTLGALPPRGPDNPVRADAPLLRFGVNPPPPLMAYHDGLKDQALVQLTWPLYVWTPGHGRESLAINLVSRIVQDQLIDTVRQKLGQSYAPTVGVSLPRGGDQGALTAKILTTPGDAAKVQEETLEIVRRIAANGVDPEALDRARKPILEQFSKEQTYNSWWMSILDGSKRYPDKLVTARQGAKELQTISLGEVNASAKLWLSGTPYAVTVMPRSILS